MELEDLYAAFVLRVPEVDRLNQLQRVLNCTKLFCVHFDSVVSMLHDQQIFLDYYLADPREILDLWDLQAVLTVQFGIQRVPSLPRLLVNDYCNFVDLHIDVAIEIVELSVQRGRRDV